MLTQDEVRRHRLAAQHLTAPLPDAAAVVKAVGGVQAQEWPSARLALRARTRGLTAEDIRHTREDQRSVVLTWTMRGTLHLVATDDLDGMLACLGPLFIRKTERRYRQLNLDTDTRQRALDAIREVLAARGPLIRSDLADAIAPYGIPVAGQAIHHLVRFAALSGVVCFGPEQDGALTYVLLDDWLAGQTRRTLTEDDALAELARRYLQAYGPATLADFINWSGLGTRQARAAWAEIDSPEVATADGLMFMPDDPVAGSVRLLPRYDNYLLGYKSRAFMVAPEHAHHVHPGGGLIRPCVIVDGRAVAVWRIERQSTVVIEPFEALETDVAADEVADIGRFLGLPLSLAYLTET